VEAYKAYARALRDNPGPITFDGEDTRRHGPVAVNSAAIEGGATGQRQALEELVAGFRGDPSSAVDRVAAALVLARRQGWLRYLDLTYNGELDAGLRAALEEAGLWVGERTLGLPVKLRIAPSDYHSTEQSETDGPPELVSLRMVALRHDEPLVGTYSDRFLLAQARGTWQAMRDAGRWVVMLTVPDSRDAAAELRRFFAALVARLREMSPPPSRLTP
jgi:hypothetical protein